MIGDIEPADVWDAGDPIDALLENLRRRVAQVIDDPDMSERNIHRLMSIDEDIEFIRGRLKREQ